MEVDIGKNTELPKVGLKTLQYNILHSSLQGIYESALDI